MNNIKWVKIDEIIEKRRQQIVIVNDHNGMPTPSAPLNNPEYEEYQNEKKSIEKCFENFDKKRIIRFYFGPKRDLDQKIVNSFANSNIQLYGNLMNALRYQDKLM